MNKNLSALFVTNWVRSSLIMLGIGFTVAQPARSQEPIVDPALVFSETQGIVAVEAEHFVKQSAHEVRAFYVTHSDSTPLTEPDGDAAHVAGASGGAYVEVLPDTRRTHDDRLIKGTNFAPDAGAMAVLDYPIHFSTPGTYYVWVRAYSTGSEDNGLHVGIDGTWPASGQRLQWCEGKNTWRWESKQRTEAQHCGEPHKIFLEVTEPGVHVIHFSMREDGFEFDKFLLTNRRDFARPDDAGPTPRVFAGSLPDPFPLVAAVVKPASMKPSEGKARPGDADSANIKPGSPIKPSELQLTAAEFAEGKLSGYYLDQDKWLAVNPNKDKTGDAAKTFPFPTGLYQVTLQSVGENDGQSTYEVTVDGKTIGQYTSPLSEQMYEEGTDYHKTWFDVPITEGAMIGVRSTIGSKDGQEFSRARWRAVSFTAADAATQAAVEPILAQRSVTPSDAAAAADVAATNDRPSSSPTRPSSDEPLQMPRGADGDGTVTIHGDLKRWHKITLDVSGPYAHEKDNSPNPFTDYRMTVAFTDSEGNKFIVPGYFAADGDAANSSAESGNVWRAHFAPDKTGTWVYSVGFRQGELAALDVNRSGEKRMPFHGTSGTFDVKESDKTGRDLRAHGRLEYVGKHYLQFAGSKNYFLKAGADAPETLLAYSDFDNTTAGNPKKAPIKTWSPHLQDWNQGDPSWGDGKGKGLVGAINYLSGKGCNVFSFLTYNAGGDGDNVWPFIARDDKLHYDCSKLDQWSVVFDHGTAKGMYLHFKLQETENDDHTKSKDVNSVPESLDGGNLGTQRKLYCREMIARFGHNLALNWNLGEENTQTTEQQLAMINYLADMDPYDHNIVIHTFPPQQEKVYRPLLGDLSKLTGVSLQNSSLETTHAETYHWVSESAKAGKPWVVAFDESGSAAHAQCPDLGYKGFDGHDRNGQMTYTQHKVRKQTLWGTLMAGGAGNEYYFGYQYDENDIVCEDWRSRDQSWDYCRIAIGFFHDHQIPFWEMVNMDELVDNPDRLPTNYCFAKDNELYLVYLSNGGPATVNLSGATGDYDVQWFDPRSGGELQSTQINTVDAGSTVHLGSAPADEDEDWLVILRKK